MVYQTNFCADTLNGSLASLQKYCSRSCAVALSHQRGSGLKLPVYKSGSLLDERNYCPISRISTCSKILEHFINKHLMA